MEAGVRTLYLDCGMGAAGDMVVAALLEMHPDPQGFVNRMNALGIPGVHVEARPCVRCGIRGTHVAVEVDGEEELSIDISADVDTDDHVHEHRHTLDGDHAHDCGHHHNHAALHDVECLVAGLDLPDKVRSDALGVYRIIAEAEAHVHGCASDLVHFHEVGTADAVADVVAACLLFYELAPELVLASPVKTGYGQVRCTHGVLPVPAPATAWILRGVPIYAGRYRGELCTPTGAALLKYFVDRFVQMPLMRIDAIGYGMGTKEFEAASCIRGFLGISEG